MHDIVESLAQSIDLPDAARRTYISVKRAYNATLDGVFYDVNCLTPGEKAELAEYAEPEGSVLVVHPANAGKRIENLRPWQFVEECEAGTCRADSICVAGVGSSAVGTAALARNIADYRQRPAAGIVSGYGMADVMSEAMSGWFVFGAKNILRDSLARLYDFYNLKDHVRDDTTHAEMKAQFKFAGIDIDRYIYGSPDSATVLFILSRLGNIIKLVVGHSKGSLSIENALEGLVAADDNPVAFAPEDLCVVTLGAVTAFPPDFTNVHQFIGTVDYFGLMNSRPFVSRKWVPDDWHSLNSELPGYLPVDLALREAGA